MSDLWGKSDLSSPLKHLPIADRKIHFKDKRRIPDWYIFSFHYGLTPNSLEIPLRYGAVVRKISTDHLNWMAFRVTATKNDSKYLSLVPEVQESTVFTVSGPGTSSDVCFFKHPRALTRL